MPRARPAVTLAHVAERCGVNKGTVSRVLNGKLHRGFTVRDELRERILRVARELGYRPSVVARSLSGAEARVVLIQGIHATWLGGGGIYDDVLARATRALNAAGLIACAAFPHPEYGEFGLLPWRLQGALIIQPPSRDVLSEIEASGVPYVSINGPCGPGGSNVLVDDVRGGREATRHLLDLGHRKIACWWPADAGHYSVRDRLKGYRAAMKSAGLRAAVVVHAPAERPHAFLRSRVLKGPVTAVITHGHHEASSILSAAHELGIRVPDRLSVIGFNDVPICARTAPPLTVMGVPARDMGREGARLLLAMMNDGAAPQTVTLASKLVRRASTTPPPEGK